MIAKFCLDFKELMAFKLRYHLKMPIYIFNTKHPRTKLFK